MAMDSWALSEGWVESRAATMMEAHPVERKEPYCITRPESAVGKCSRR